MKKGQYANVGFRRAKVHRVAPPTPEQLVAWRIHCSLRLAPGGMGVFARATKLNHALKRIKDGE